MVWSSPKDENNNIKRLCINFCESSTTKDIVLKL